MQRIPRNVLLAVALAGILLATGLPVVAATHTVTMRDNAYRSTRVEVRVGDRVSWVNGGQAPHDAVANDGSWSIALLTNGESGSVRFSRTGTWRYHCSIHPEMRGTIVVRSAGVTIPPTDTQAPSGIAAAIIGLAGIAAAWLTIRRVRSTS
jgi:plastocyanin